MAIQIKKLALIFLAVLLCSTAYGATKYGEATIKKGNVVIVRDGRMYLYTTANNPVTLYEKDTIRTLKNTSLTLYNPDQHRIILGSNAIMQLKKWRKKKEQGILRMLFGKFRARTAAVQKRTRLNVRTATATIGIKGSLGDGATSSDFTSLSNLSGDMSVSNNEGDEVDVPSGQFAFNVDGKDQDFSFEDIPDYDPGKSEDEMETADTDNLDTEDPKEVDVPPVIEDAIEEGVTEVADADDDLDGDDLEGDEGLPDIVNTVGDIINDIQDTASDANPSIDANITIED